MNQSAIGVNLAYVEGQKEWVLYTKENAVAVFSAPVNLVQGGLGIVVRVPIEAYEKYIGQISIVFDYMKTLETTGIIQLSKNHIVSLRVYDFLKQDYADVWTNRVGPYTYAENLERKVSLEIYDVFLSLTAIPKMVIFQGPHYFTGSSSWDWWLPQWLLI